MWCLEIHSILWNIFEMDSKYFNGSKCYFELFYYLGLFEIHKIPWDKIQNTVNISISHSYAECFNIIFIEKPGVYYLGFLNTPKLCIFDVISLTLNF